MNRTFWPFFTFVWLVTYQLLRRRLRIKRVDPWLDASIWLGAITLLILLIGR